MRCARARSESRGEVLSRKPMDGRGMPIDVIYIAGAPRSGTTILSQLLGELPGLFNVGEARFLWRQVLSSGRCGCGTRLIACDFWREVLTDSPVPSGDDRARTETVRTVRSPDPILSFAFTSVRLLTDDPV